MRRSPINFPHPKWQKKTLIKTIITNSIPSAKNWEEAEEVESTEECFILDFNPTQFPKIDNKIVSVKKREDVKKVEEVEDCFILEFDPFEDDEKVVTRVGLMFSKLCVQVKTEVADYDCGDDDDVQILGVRGKVACRDYPHPRHLCAMHPFKETPHHIHCEMCYCYVCDKSAPCKKWTKGCKNPILKHCDATPDMYLWKRRRERKMQQSDGDAW